MCFKKKRNSYHSKWERGWKIHGTPGTNIRTTTLSLPSKQYNRSLQKSTVEIPFVGITNTLMSYCNSNSTCYRFIVFTIQFLLWYKKLVELAPQKLATRLFPTIPLLPLSFNALLYEQLYSHFPLSYTFLQFRYLECWNLMIACFKELQCMVWRERGRTWI